VKKHDPREESILDGNIARLLRHAYVPARPSPRFRAELGEMIHAELARLSGTAPVSLSPPRPRRLRPLVVLATAAALLALAFAGMWGLGVFERTLDLGEIHQRGLVALREDPDGPWRALSPEMSEVGLDLTETSADRWIEIATPPLAALTVREGGDRIAIAASTALSIERSELGLRAQLERGSIAIERDSDEGEWTVVTGQGTLAASRARLAVGEEAARVRLLLESGRAWVASATGRVPLPEGREVFLIAGALDVPPVLPTPDEPVVSTSRREAIGSTGIEPATAPPSTEGITVRGRVVVDATGEGVKRFRVALLRERTGNSFYMPEVAEFEDAEGFFEWEGVVPLRYEVIVHAEGFGVLRSKLTSGDEEGVIDLELRLTPGGRVRGLVVDPATGSPLPGATVASMRDAAAGAIPFDLESFPVWLPASAETGGDGSFELPHLSAGDHRLRVSAPGFAPRWLEPIGVTEGGEIELAPVELSRGGILEGIVTGANGAPAAERRLIVTPMSAPAPMLMNFGMTLTDGEGHFRVEDLPSGFLLAILLLDESGREPPLVRPFESAGGATARLDFRIEAPGTRVVGRLLDARGKAVAGRNLALVPVDDPAEDPADDPATNPANNPGEGSEEEGDERFIATCTDSDGSWCFEAVEPGHYRLLAVLDGSGEELLWLDELEVTSQPEVRHDLRLEEGEITGRITDAANGEAVPDCLAYLLRLDPLARTADFAGQVRASDEGVWRFRTVPSGSYRVMVLPRRGSLGFECSEEFIVDSVAPRVVRDMALDPGCVARVTAVDREGHPLGDVMLEFRLHPEGIPVRDQYLATDRNGKFTLVGLRPGTYRVRAVRRGYEIAEVEFEGRLGVQGEVRIVLREQP
jgi:hypothetical protein